MSSYDVKPLTKRANVALRALYKYGKLDLLDPRLADARPDLIDLIPGGLIQRTDGGYELTNDGRELARRLV